MDAGESVVKAHSAKVPVEVDRFRAKIGEQIMEKQVTAKEDRLPSSGRCNRPRWARWRELGGETDKNP